MGFKDLNLSAELHQAIDELGFTEPTPIQAQSIPVFLDGHDLIGSAQTGTGKTAAFVLPIMTKLGKPRHKPRALILEPTRELALQVQDALEKFGKYTAFRSTVIYGGVGYGKQKDALKTGVDIVVGTPGRIIDHIQQKSLSLSDLEYLILDEADRMLDMGFIPSVRKIINACPKKRQTALFSATISREIEQLSRFALQSPISVEISPQTKTADTIDHFIYPVAESQKSTLAYELLAQDKVESAIIFCRTRIRADKFAHYISNRGLKAAIIHSSKTQKDREKALASFRERKVKFLVATDIAARGLDIPEVSHVMNYDVPQNPEDYVHRIGRTGRASRSGEAFTLFVTEDLLYIEAIEKYLGRKIDRKQLDLFDYKYTALLDRSSEKKMVERRRAVRGVRLSGGYYYGPVKKKRR
jgi:ATP-dependent RNA helicase RhlE